MPVGELIFEDESCPENTAPKKRIAYNAILARFNLTMQGCCIPQIKALSDKRKKALALLLAKYSEEDVFKAFDMARQSSFLNGDNRNGFRASFDWIVNKNNFLKIIENNYADHYDYTQPTRENQPAAEANPLANYPVCSPMR